MTKYLTDEQLANSAANFYGDIGGYADERNNDLSDVASDSSHHDTSSQFEGESEEESDEDLGM